jgi:hypothetical protein
LIGFIALQGGKNMSKWKDFALALVFLSIAVVCLSAGQYIWVAAFGTAGLVYGGKWYYKFQRDRGFITKGQEARELAATKGPAAPPRTSPGSTGLFVPPPLD